MKDGEVYFTGQVSLKAIIVSPRGRVLICRNLKDPELWDLPGGTLNVGEKPEEALLREIQEEIGVTPTLGEPFVADVFVKPLSGKEVFVLVYMATLPAEPQEFVLDKTEIAEAKWISKQDLEHTNLFPEYKRALEVFYST